MNKTTSLLASMSACTFLVACGGGTTGGDAAPSYAALSSTEARTSTLGGVAVRSNSTSGVLDVVTTSGTTRHNTGNTTITDGVYTLTDPDGFNGGDTLTDGLATITTNSSAFSGSYEYVAVYDQTYIAGGQRYDSVGIGGVISSAADVPASGSATYTGEASGSIVTTEQGFDLISGTSTVSANFGAGTVDATMTGFTAIDVETGNTTVAPIDTISMTGMAIAGNGFSGGTVTTTNAGTAVNLTGANTTTETQGAFFGYDAVASAPDEVGGLILQQGNDALVVGGFIAD